MIRRRIDVRISRVVVDESLGVDAAAFRAALADRIEGLISEAARTPGAPAVVDRTADAVVDALAAHGVGARAQQDEAAGR